MALQVDALENDGRTQENRGPGGRGIAAPRANNVHTLFDNSTILTKPIHSIFFLQWITLSYFL